MLWHVVVPLDAVSEDSDCHFDEKTWLHVDLGRSMKAYRSLLHIVERMESWERCVSGMSGLSSAMLTLLDPCRNLYQFLGDSSLFIGIYIILYHFIFCFMILNYVKLYFSVFYCIILNCIRLYYIYVYYYILCIYIYYYLLNIILYTILLCIYIHFIFLSMMLLLLYIYIYITIIYILLFYIFYYII